MVKRPMAGNNKRRQWTDEEIDSKFEAIMEKGRELDFKPSPFMKTRVLAMAASRDRARAEKRAAAPWQLRLSHLRALALMSIVVPGAGFAYVRVFEPELYQ